MKSTREVLGPARVWLTNRVRAVTELYAPRVAGFLVDRLGIMALPGYTALARRVLSRWVRAVDAAIETDFYLKQLEPEARRGAARDPALHYCLAGWMQGFSPAVRFDPLAYRQSTTGLHWAADPFLHYVEDQARRDRFGQSVAAVPPSPVAAPAPSRSERRSARCVIYTAVAGGYDVVRAPEFFPPDCDFVALSDRALDARGWAVRPLLYDHEDPRRAARHAKLHPHLYFPEYTHSLWIDANIGVRGDVRHFLEALTDDSAVGAFIHPARNCVFDEGDEWIRRLDPEAEAIGRQLARYRDEGHPAGAGLWETPVMVRRHHDPSCVALMTEWWREIERGSARDQISFPVVARRQSRTVAVLAPTGIHARNHPHLTSAPHLLFRLPPDPTIPPLSAERRKVRLEVLGLTVVVLGKDETLGEPLLLAGFDRRASRVVFADEDAIAASVNAILDASGGDWIVLLDGGTRLPADGLRRLVEAGEQLPRLGVVGPISDALLAGEGEGAFREIMDDLPMEQVAALCSAASDGRSLLVPGVRGPCVAIRRSMLESLGGLNATIPGSVWEAVFDLCLRAEDHGFVNCISTDGFVAARVTKVGFPRPTTVYLQGVPATERVEMAMEKMRNHPGLKALRRRILALAGRDGLEAD